MTRVIMFQGTGSDVGKSIVTAGFCRLLVNKGYTVTPFKSQNMALNSGVTADGLEMGRAQILQAEAAKILPSITMNPILIKPQGKGNSQLIKMGKVAGSYSFKEYYTLAGENFKVAQTAFDTLKSEYDFIVMEGAGSPAEINLQKTDIVNMRMADYANADVYLIADIDRGGVFAWLKGTYDLIQDEYKPLIKGCIINKFRGDYSLLKPGIKMFEELVPFKTLGTLPYLKLNLDEEDSQNLSSKISTSKTSCKIAVIQLPYISNFNDFTPLKMIDGVAVKFTTKTKDLEDADLIILPGSKNTIEDLSHLKSINLFDVIKNLIGKKLVIGICGGFQMLGNVIKDPSLIEGKTASLDGLGIFNMETILGDTKVTKSKQYQGEQLLSGIDFKGYEIHMGISKLNDKKLVQLIRQKDICIYEPDKKVIGTYIHGFFDTASITKKILTLIGKPDLVIVDYTFEKERQLDELASTIENNCDWESIIYGAK